jgi:hypothetical protein
VTAVSDAPGWFETGLSSIMSTKRCLHGLSVCRALVGVMFAGLLLTNIGVRRVLWGSASQWVDPYREGSSFDPVLVDTRHLSGTVFDIAYVVVIVAAVSFALGWRTRASGLVLLLGSVQLVEQNPLLGDQGDNIARIGLLYLLFTSCGAVWSLDARRRARLPRTTNESLATLGTVVHNVALGLLVAQIMLVYVAAGLNKADGDPWRYGTALYYPLQLPEFRPFGFLSDLLTGSPLLLGLSTYLVVFLQVFFPALLLHRVTRRPAVVGMVMTHLGIAVMMGLPWFSMSMVAFDALFVSAATYRTIDGWATRRVAARSRPRADAVPERAVAA